LHGSVVVRRGKGGTGQFRASSNKAVSDPSLEHGGVWRRRSYSRKAAARPHEGVPLVVIQRQLGHSNLGVTSIYFQGIDNAEVIDTVHARRAPMIPVRTSLHP
jgi:hypothetical protein